MLRTVKIAVEYIFYITAFVAGWVLATGISSFILLDYQFTDERALLLLRICIVAGFIVATVKTIILIANNKI